MSTLRAWIQASRPLAQGNIALPLFLGQALAVERGFTLSWVTFSALIVWGLLDQLMIVFINDLADQETDADNVTFAFASGGSRVLVEGKISRPAMLRAAWIVSLLLGVYSGALSWMLARPHLWIAWLAAVGLIAGYSLRPLRGAYHKGAELWPTVGMGVVLPTLGYYAQSGTIDGLSCGALMSATLFGLAGNITTGLPDAPSDARASKQTVSVVFGEARARACSLGVLGCAVAMTLAYRGGGSVTSILLIALPTSILLAINTFFLRGADAADRSACHRFVLRNLMAQAVAMVGWILCAAAAL